MVNKNSLLNHVRNKSCLFKGLNALIEIESQLQ